MGAVEELLRRRKLLSGRHWALSAGRDFVGVFCTGNERMSLVHIAELIVAGLVASSLFPAVESDWLWLICCQKLTHGEVASLGSNRGLVMGFCIKSYKLPSLVLI